MPTHSNFCAFGRLLVRLKGLEPSRRETPDPKSGASANSATSAGHFLDCGCKITMFLAIMQIFFNFFAMNGHIWKQITTFAPENNEKKWNKDSFMKCADG